MVGLNPREFVSRGTFSACCCQCPCPCDEPLPTHASTGGPPTLAGSFGSVSYKITALFLWVLMHARFCFFPSKTGGNRLGETVLWKPYNQIHWPSRPHSLGILNPLLDPKAGMPDMGFRTFTTVAELLSYYCSPLCGSPTQRVWDLILS